ncbi:MAG: squalene synthase [Chitinophagales bacterium]
MSNSILKYKERVRQIGKYAKSSILPNTISKNEAEQYCYETLEKVSRSFAVVIRELRPELRDGVCVFYLSLRALDSIEDDLEIPLSIRLKYLHAFHKHLGDESFSLQNIGDHPDYRNLLENYGLVAKMYNQLPEPYRNTIHEIASKMGQGMAYYSQTPVESKHDYNEYCHYVAGLVGMGLSELFVASGTESKELVDKWEKSNAMGLFLQKTNITRDFAEDLDSGRFFWPEEIWEKYCNAPSELQAKPESPEALMCLNEMILNALEHFNECIDYMELLQDKSVFRFCAIPQVMALATLKKLYNNPLVFTENVKISKKESTKVFLDCNDMQSFLSLCASILDQWEINGETAIDQSLKVVLKRIAEKNKAALVA